MSDEPMVLSEWRWDADDRTWIAEGRCGMRFHIYTGPDYLLVGPGWEVGGHYLELSDAKDAAEMWYDDLRTEDE